MLGEPFSTCFPVLTFVHVSGDVFNLPPKHTNERWKGILIGNAGSVRFCCKVAINLWKDQPGGGEEIDVATS